MITNLVVATISSYCICKACCGPNAKGITANGKTPQGNHTIAASRKIPFGTQCVIDGISYTVEDRLAKRFDDRFDVFMPSHEAARQFGIKHRTVQVITK